MSDSSLRHGCVTRDSSWSTRLRPSRRNASTLLLIATLFGATMGEIAVQPLSLSAAETLPVPAASTAPPPRGSLVIIGGAARHDNEAIWSEVLRLAGGQGGRIAVFPCASSYPLKNGQRAVKLLKSHGADAFLVPVALSGIDGVNCAEAVRDPAIIEQVRGASGVYFIGGSQSRICEALVDKEGRNSPLLDAVWDVYRRGGVVAGTSAGAAIMSRVMFRDPGLILNNMLQGVKMGKEVDHGLGFLDSNWFVDQHCLVRGRFARALVAMRDQHVRYGLGIDEDTAIVVEADERARVIGNRGAVVLDLSQADSDEQVRKFNLRNARLTYLNHGDAIHLRTLQVTPNPAKQADRKIDPTAPDFRPTGGRRLFYMDVLANTTLVDVMTRVIEHRDGQAIGLAFDGAAAAEGDTPGFEFRFYRAADSFGWETDAHGTTDCTIQNIHLDVRPITVQGPLYSAASSADESPRDLPPRVVAGGASNQ